MATLDEFSLEVRLFMRAYRWWQVERTPWTPLAQPLAETRLALVSSAAMILEGQEPFDDSRGSNDPSFREIPWDVDESSLLDTHPSTHFDHSGLCRDPNVAFPIRRVRELVERGRVGSLSPYHLTFRGSLLNPRKLYHETAPAAARRLREHGVQAAILCPV